MIKNLEDRYLDLIRPDRFIQLFKDENEFREWLELGSIEDLEACKTAFLEFELYEQCKIIQEFIKKKENE